MRNQKERENEEGAVFEVVCQEGAMFEGHLSELIRSLWVNLKAGLFEMFNERMMVIGALIGGQLYSLTCILSK